MLFPTVFYFMLYTILFPSFYALKLGLQPNFLLYMYEENLQWKEAGKCLKTCISPYFLRVVPTLLGIHFFCVVYGHVTRSKAPAYNYLDPGYLARYAITKGKPALLKIYLRFGGNPNFRDEHLNVLFEYAIHKNNIDCGKLLLKYGAKTTHDDLTYVTQDFFKEKSCWDRGIYLSCPLFKIADSCARYMDHDDTYTIQWWDEELQSKVVKFIQKCSNNDQLSINT